MALFGCLWISDFPVWAALQANPSLSSPLLCVQRAGRLTAVSPAALEAGVWRGWTPARALALHPHLVVLPFDAAACAFAWQQVLGALYELTPRIEPRQQGQAIFEVPSRPAGRRDLVRLTKRWEARCGVAETRALAELAALAAQVGQVQRVRRGEDVAFLKRVPVDVLGEAGVSPATMERLHWFGLHSVGSLRMIPARQIKEQFPEGVMLARFTGTSSSCAEVRPVAAWTPPVVVEAHFAFEAPAIQPCEWELALAEVLERGYRALNGRGASSLGVAIETPQGRRAASRLLREPVTTASALRAPAQRLLDGLLGQSRTELQRIEVRLGDLSDVARQQVLWATSEQRRSELQGVLRRLEARHAGALQRLQARDIHAPLPEERFTLVPALEGKSQREAMAR